MKDLLSISHKLVQLTFELVDMINDMSLGWGDEALVNKVICDFDDLGDKQKKVIEKDGLLDFIYLYMMDNSVHENTKSLHLYALSCSLNDKGTVSILETRSNFLNGGDLGLIQVIKDAECALIFDLEELVSKFNFLYTWYKEEYIPDNKLSNYNPINESEIFENLSFPDREKIRLLKASGVLDALKIRMNKNGETSNSHLAKILIGLGLVNTQKVKSIDSFLNKLSKGDEPEYGRDTLNNLTLLKLTE